MRVEETVLRELLTLRWQPRSDEMTDGAGHRRSCIDAIGGSAHRHDLSLVQQGFRYCAIFVASMRFDRIERGIEYCIPVRHRALTARTKLSGHCAAVPARPHDRVVVLGAGQDIPVRCSPSSRAGQAWNIFRCSPRERAALDRADGELGLALSADEIDYLVEKVFERI